MVVELVLKFLGRLRYSAGVLNMNEMGTGFNFCFTLVTKRFSARQLKK